MGPVYSAWEYLRWVTSWFTIDKAWRFWGIGQI